ncbi:MAG: hypothetical protein HY606_13450 [Planctomycetes bacterium]|nr:hypothetical protein [Planctomycetota bacterium]
MQETFFHKIIKKLAKHRVCYLIVGGTAVNLHGVPRLTKDLDLMIDLNKANITRFINAMDELGYIPRAPVKIQWFADPQKRKKWVESKKSVVFTLVDPKPPFFSIDVFLNNPLDFNHAFSGRTTLHLKQHKLELVSVKDLIRQLFSFMNARQRK